MLKMLRSALSSAARARLSVLDVSAAAQIKAAGTLHSMVDSRSRWRQRSVESVAAIAPVARPVEENISAEVLRRKHLHLRTASRPLPRPLVSLKHGLALPHTKEKYGFEKSTYDVEPISAAEHTQRLTQNGFQPAHLPQEKSLQQ
jgi:hypothetical protein